MWIRLAKFCVRRPSMVSELTLFRNKLLFAKKMRWPEFTRCQLSASNSSNASSNHAGHQAGTKIASSFLARQFINTLDLNERQIIKEELIKAENELQGQLGPDGKKIVATPNWRQLFMVGFQSGLPFIGFGFVDNFLMIVAGDLIESYIGVFLPISTMAAAGLGNGFSDVAGIGLSHHIEFYCSRFIGEMKLTPEQFNLRIVNWIIIFSKSICIFLGCVIGMAPLLFINHQPKTTETTTTGVATTDIEKIEKSSK